MSDSPSRPRRAARGDRPASEPEARFLALGGLIYLISVALFQVGEATRYQLILATLGAGLGIVALNAARLRSSPPPLGAAALWLIYGLLHSLAGPTCGYAARAGLARRGLHAGTLAVAMAMASTGPGLTVVRVGLITTGGLAGASALWDRVSPGPERGHWRGDDPGAPGARARVGGLYGNPNLLGGILALVLPIALAAAARATTPAPMIATGVAVVLVSAGLGASYSRSCWLAAAAGVAALFWLSSQRRRLAGVATVGLLTLFLAAPGAGTRLASTVNGSSFGVSQRKAVLTGVAEMAADAPLLGHGIGSFAAAFPRYRVLGGQYPLDAHCQYLQEVVESGVLGVALFLLILAGALAVCRRRRRSPDVVDRPDLEAALLGSFVWMAFASPLSYTPVGLPWLFVLGAAAAPSELTGSDRRASRGAGTRWILGAGLVMAVISAVGVARGIGPRSEARAGMAGVRGLAGEPGAISAIEVVAPDIFDALREAEARDPGAPEDALMRGHLLLGLGRLEPAEAAFQEAISRDRGEAWAWRGMAAVELARGQTEAAIEDLDRALELDRQSEDTMRQKAELLVRLGRMREAEALLRQAISTNPPFLKINRDTYPKVMLALIHLLERLGREDEAAGWRTMFLETYGDLTSH